MPLQRIRARVGETATAPTTLARHPQTGPKTEEGKAIAAANATTHGILSRAPVIEGEREEDWLLFRDAIIADLAPDGAIEQLLSNEIAGLSWRLFRVLRYEQAAVAATRTTYEQELEGDPDALPLPGYERAWRPEPTLEQVRALAVLPRGKWVEKVARYESHLVKQRQRALGQLLRLQERRTASDDQSAKRNGVWCDD